MSEALFYHLVKRSLEDVLPGLIERTLERGWRALIKVESAERADAIDNLLWTYKERSFLPHAQLGDGEAERQPVLITIESKNSNRADVLFLVGGAEPPEWRSPSNNAFTRVVLLFDGREEDALARARVAWKTAREAGHDVTYWKESASGKWDRQ
jgi:DNA polymerase-3 subunit chi